MYLFFASIIVLLLIALIFLALGPLFDWISKRSHHHAHAHHEMPHEVSHETPRVLERIPLPPDDTRRVLLIVSAFIEVFAGLSLAVSPSQSLRLFLGSPLEDPTALALARLAGAAISSLGIACWLASKDGRSYAGTGLVGAMLLYNLAAGSVLASARFAAVLPGPLLWPSVLLHGVMALWCFASLVMKPGWMSR